MLLLPWGQLLLLRSSSWRCQDGSQRPLGVAQSKMSLLPMLDHRQRQPEPVTPLLALREGSARPARCGTGSEIPGGCLVG